MTKINWKQLAQTEGYKSLKRAAILQKDYKTFNWAINRAKHYSYYENRRMEEILLCWENLRTQFSYTYLDTFYNNNKLPRLDKTKRKEYIRPKRRKIMKREKSKLRWSIRLKKEEKKYKEWLKSKESVM